MLLQLRALGSPMLTFAVLANVRILTFLIFASANLEFMARVLADTFWAAQSFRILHLRDF